MVISVQVQAWLDKPDDYGKGLRLYEQLGLDDSVMPMLELGPTKYNREKLYDLLAAAVPVDQEVVQPHFPTLGELIPPKIANIERQWKEHYQKLHAIKLSLPAMEPQERRKACLAIVEGFQEHIVKAWDVIDRYTETGEVPEEKEEDTWDNLEPLLPLQVKAVKQLFSLPVRLTRAKKKKDQDLIHQLDKEIQTIKEKLYYE